MNCLILPTTLDDLRKNKEKKIIHQTHFSFLVAKPNAYLESIVPHLTSRK